MKVLHVIFRDKNFHNLYVDCQEKLFGGVNENYFFIIGPEKNGKISVDYPNVYTVEEATQIRENPLLSRLKEECNIVIVTGIFSMLKKNLLQIIDGVESKTYLQFWGGDYYDHLPMSLAKLVRSTNSADFKKNIKKFKRNFKPTQDKKNIGTAIDKCAGVMVLTDGEEGEIKKAFPNVKKCYSVPFSINLNLTGDINVGVNAENAKSKRIIVGNSANATNRHKDVFEMLMHLDLENVEIICPLSYGDEEYAKKIKAYGKECFGNKFHSLDTLMTPDDYSKLLMTCDVGIFCMKRQQALGNIGKLLVMGKKVYVNSASPTWTKFSNEGYKIFDSNEIKNMNTEEFFRMDKAFIDQNLNARKNEVNHFAMNWKNFYAEVGNVQKNN